MPNLTEANLAAVVEKNPCSLTRFVIGAVVDSLHMLLFGWRSPAIAKEKCHALHFCLARFPYDVD